MKKYVIKNADGSKQKVMPAIHNTRREALLAILHYATKVVEEDKDDSYTEIPIDYIVKEEEDIAVNKRITNFWNAREALGINSNPIRVIPGQVSSKTDFSFSSVIRLVEELNPKHLNALIALNQLFTIAEAWNKEDKFIPDFSDYNQIKWYPRFKYDKDAARFVLEATYYMSKYASTSIGSRLCFKTQERAEQFGKQFDDLYNKAFL